jgi:hypothetical protein
MMVMMMWDDHGDYLFMMMMMMWDGGDDVR